MDLMSFVYTGLEAILGALFLYYILILIFGNSKGTIPFVIYLLVSVFRVVTTVMTYLYDDIAIYYPVINGVIMLLPHALFIIMMVRKFGLFNINFRGRRFKQKLKNSNPHFSPVGSKRKRILLVGTFAALAVSTVFLVLKLTINAEIEYVVIIFGYVITLAGLVTCFLLKYKKDKIAVIIGKNEKRIYEKVLTKKVNEKKVIDDDSYFLDYSGLAYVNDEKGYMTIYHMFILNNDAPDLKLEDLSQNKSELSSHFINDFEKYKEKSVYYKITGDNVIKVREE